MAGQVEARLAALGITVPEAAAPVANYVGYVKSGNLVFVSGQVPVVGGAFKTSPQGVGVDCKEATGGGDRQLRPEVSALGVALDGVDRVQIHGGGALVIEIAGRPQRPARSTLMAKIQQLDQRRSGIAAV
ncbi:MAG: hypothetical protein IH924_05675 [Proteobacteria bacterium]|nr:hypothetical protein [Pseudomonadota bacterium]